jgi:hypothetical protein
MAAGIPDPGLQVVEGFEGGRVPADSRRRRVRHGNPAVGPFDRPPDGLPAVATNPDGWVRLLNRAREHGVAGNPEVPAISFHGRPAPGRLHQVQGLVGELVALVEVHPQGGKLPFQISGGHPEYDPAARQGVESGDRLGGQEGVPIRQYAEVGLQTDAAGARRRESEGDEGSRA